MLLKLKTKGVPFYPLRPFTAFGGESIKSFAQWLAQPKINGWRVLFDPETKQCWNRYGQPFTGDCSPLDAWEDTGFYLDCEYLGRRTKAGAGSLVVLDAIAKGNDPDPFYVRQTRLASLPEVPMDDLPENVLMRITNHPHEKCPALFEEMKEVNKRRGEIIWEGVVLKHPASTYDTQRRSPHEESRFWAKAKFEQKVLGL